MKQIRPRITPDEYSIIKQHRGLHKECEANGIPIEGVNHYWYKGKHYSINVKTEERSTDFDRLKEILKENLNKTYTYKATEHIKDVSGVLKWSDLHFGAHIRNLLITNDYDSNVLYQGLMQSVEQINHQGFKEVHVHINGDLIESFTGLNHINSWLSLNKEQIGANAVRLCAEMLDNVFKEVNNLGSIKIVAGNHDRVTSRNDEDVKGGAAKIIAWALELMGYDVEFHPYIITHKVDGINHINLHGDRGISKRTTPEIIWKFGEKGVFNFVFEGHLHSIIEKLSVKSRDNFKVIKDDNIDYRRMHLPSFFTGNYYSETLGYSANAGYVVVWDNGNGKPNLFTGAI